LTSPPRGSLFLQTDGVGPLTIGAPHIESSVPIGVSAVFSLLGAERKIAVEAGVGSPRFL